MISMWSDKIRKDYRVYLEPVLATAAAHQAGKVGVKTLSRYIRRAVVLALKFDGYPLDQVTEKFKKINVLYKGVTSCVELHARRCFREIKRRRECHYQIQSLILLILEPKKEVLRLVMSSK
jgi:hypothetical protein